MGTFFNRYLKIAFIFAVLGTAAYGAENAASDGEVNGSTWHINNVRLDVTKEGKNGYNIGQVMYKKTLGRDKTHISFSGNDTDHFYVNRNAMPTYRTDIDFNFDGSKMRVTLKPDPNLSTDHLAPFFNSDRDEYVAETPKKIREFLEVIQKNNYIKSWELLTFIKLIVEKNAKGHMTLLTIEDVKNVCNRNMVELKKHGIN